MANLPGVMRLGIGWTCCWYGAFGSHPLRWYLHSEVVGHCPRKFGIVRILRYKVCF